MRSIAYGRDLDVFYVDADGNLVQRYYQKGWHKAALSGPAVVAYGHPERFTAIKARFPGPVTIVKDFDDGDIGSGKGNLDITTLAENGTALVHAYWRPMRPGPAAGWYSELLP